MKHLFVLVQLAVDGIRDRMLPWVATALKLVGLFRSLRVSSHRLCSIC